jgi:hypothetical protein
MKYFEETSKAIKLVFSRKKCLWVSLIFGIVSFGFLYYFLVSSVADNDIWISVMMSGAGFVTFSIISSLLIAGLSGILISMVLFKFDNFKKIEGKGFFGFLGSGIGAFGVGCPTCGAFLFSLIGLPLALTYLPFRGLELQALSVVILLVSVYFTGKSINGVCKIG